MNVLEKLSSWTDPVGSRDAMRARIARHRQARGTLVLAGVPADIVEVYNLATLAYSSWTEMYPRLQGGPWPDPLTSEEAEGAPDGELLLTLAYAAQSVILRFLQRPLLGRMTVVRFRRAYHRYPMPVGYAPAGHSEGPARGWLEEMRRVRPEKPSSVRD